MTRVIEYTPEEIKALIENDVHDKSNKVMIVSQLEFTENTPGALRATVVELVL